MSKFNSVFQQCQMDAVNAATAKSPDFGSGLPVGRYTVRHVGSEPLFWERTEEPHAGRYPNIMLKFEVVTSSDSPALVGKPFNEFFRLGPAAQNKQTGEFFSPGAATLRGMYKKLFDEDPPVLMGPNDEPLTDEEGNALVDTEAMVVKVAVEGVGTCWQAVVTETTGKNGQTYVNTRINGVVRS